MGNRKRPLLVTVYAVMGAFLFTGGLAVLTGSAAWHWLGHTLPASPDGMTTLDLFAENWVLNSLSIVAVGLFSYGLWRGESWVRYLIVGVWVSASVYAISLHWSHMTIRESFESVAIALPAPCVLYWYFFRKRASVEFFSGSRERAV